MAEVSAVVGVIPESSVHETSTNRPRNFLITGGCGFIASNFIEYLFKNENDSIQSLVNIDCMNYCSSKRELQVDPSRYHFVKGNITDYDMIRFLLDFYKIDIVIHFAAQSHVDNSFDSVKTLQYTIDNVLGTHVIMQACKDYGRCEKILHMSTDEVYGQVDTDHKGCSEYDLLNPTNPYAATKAAAEFIVRSYYHSYRLPCIIIRCNNVYGPHQYPEKLIPRFIHYVQEGKKLTIHGTGTTRRNFIWVDDVSSAICCIWKRGHVDEIYNIGTSNEYSVYEIAEIILSFDNKYVKNGETVEYVEDRPFNDFRYAINSSKLRELGWKEEHTNFLENVKFLYDLQKKRS